MMFALSLLMCFLIAPGEVQESEEQKIEVGDLVLILNSKLRQNMPAGERGGPRGDDFQAYVVELSPDGKRVAYEMRAGSSFRRGTISTKYVELVRKGRPLRKPRKWTSRSGDNTIEATLSEINDGSVVLKKKNGKTITVKADSLSEDDQAYISRMRDSSLERRAVVDKPLVPFGTKRKKLVTKKWNWKAHPIEHETPNGTFQSIELPVLVSIDRMAMTANEAHSGSFGVPGESLLGKPRVQRGSRGPGARHTGARAMMRGMRGRGQDSFRIWESAFSDDGKQLFILANQLEGQNSAVITIDLANDEIVSSEMLDAFALAISTSGRRVALIQTNGPEQLGELILRRVGDTEILKRLPLQASSKRIVGGFHVCRGAFMNDSTLITIGNEIVGFDVATGKGYATQRFPLDTILEDVAVSPNRKHVAAMSSNGILLFDSSRGNSIGSIAFDDNFSGDSCTFSPRGNRLAVFSRGASLLNLYDLETGKLYDSVSIEETVFDHRISWPDERFVLVGDDTLVDLELKTKVWEFEMADRGDAGLTPIRDDWYLYCDARTSVVPVQLPLGEIKNRLDEFDVESSMVLGEGDTFSIELDLPFSDAEQDEIFEKLRRNLESRKLVFDENSENVFVCFVEDGKRQSKPIRVGGTLRDPELQQATWTTTYSCIELIVDGNLKWEKQTINSPNRGNIMRKGNESLDATIRRLASPKASQFFGRSLPQQFFDFPGGDSVLGRSSVSLGGVGPR